MQHKFLVQISYEKHSQMIGSPLTSVHRLRHRSPNLMWRELKSELSRQYSSIPFNSHATQAFAHLQQGLDELLKMYLCCASEILSKIHHPSDLSQFLAEGLNHYTAVYGLNSRKLMNNAVGHWCVHWRSWKTASEISMHLMQATKSQRL